MKSGKSSSEEPEEGDMKAYLPEKGVSTYD